MDYTIVVPRPASEPRPDAVHRAVLGLRDWPSTSCTNEKKATLCVSDDLSKQAAAYRQLSLVCGARPRGRRPRATCSTCTAAC